VSFSVEKLQGIVAIIHEVDTFSSHLFPPKDVDSEIFKSPPYKYVRGYIIVKGFLGEMLAKRKKEEESQAGGGKGMDL
jgi:hypothetical protein